MSNAHATLKNINPQSNQMRALNKPYLDGSGDQSVLTKRRGASNESQPEDYVNAVASVQQSQHAPTKIFSSATSNQKLNTSVCQVPRNRSPLYSESQQFVYSNIGSGVVTGTAATRQVLAVVPSKNYTNDHTKAPNSQQLRELNRQTLAKLKNNQETGNLASLSSLESRTQYEQQQLLEQIEVLGHGAQNSLYAMNYQSELNSVQESLQSLHQNPHNEDLSGVDPMFQASDPMTNDLVRKNRKYGRASALHFVKQNLAQQVQHPAHSSSMSQVRWHKHQGQASLSQSKHLPEDRMIQSKHSRFDSSHGKQDKRSGTGSKSITFDSLQQERQNSMYKQNYPADSQLSKHATSTNRDGSMRNNKLSSVLEAASKSGGVQAFKGASPKLRASMLAQKSKVVASRATQERSSQPQSHNTRPTPTVDTRKIKKNSPKKQRPSKQDYAPAYGAANVVNSKKSVKGKSPLASRPLKSVQQPQPPQTQHQSVNNSYAVLSTNNQNNSMEIIDKQQHQRSLTVIKQETTDDFYQNSNLSPIDGESLNADSFGGNNSYRTLRAQDQEISPASSAIKLPLAVQIAAAKPTKSVFGNKAATRMRNQSHKSSKSNGAQPMRSSNQIVNPYTDLAITSNNFVATDGGISGPQVICVEKTDDQQQSVRRLKEKKLRHQNVNKIGSISVSRRASLQESNKLTPYAPQSEKAQSIFNSISQKSFSSGKSSIQSSFTIEDNPEITGFKEQNAHITTTTQARIQSDPIKSATADDAGGRQAIMNQSFGVKQIQQQSDLRQLVVDRQDSMVRIDSVLEHHSNSEKSQSPPRITGETPHADEKGFSVLQISFGRDDELRGIIATADQLQNIESGKGAHRNKTPLKSLIPNAAQIETSSQKKNLISQRRYDEHLASSNRNGSPVFKTIPTSFGNKVMTADDAAMIRGSPRPMARNNARPQHGSPNPVRLSTRKSSKESDRQPQKQLSQASCADSRNSSRFSETNNMREEQKDDNERLEPHSFLNNVSGPVLIDESQSTTMLKVKGPIVDTENLSRQLNVPKPAANQDLMLLPDFKLAALPITHKMLPSKYSLVRQQAFAPLNIVPALEKFHF